MFLANKLNKGGSLSSPDAQFNYVTMLLHGDGTNGAQNNTFLDSSTNNFTITRNGNTTQGSFSPYGSNWSNYFDGSGDYLSVANNANLNLGSGDFTLECWIFPTSASGIIWSQWNNGGDNSGYLYLNGTNFQYRIGGTTYSFGSFSTNTWTHVAVSRSGSSVYLFVNGSLVSTQTNSTNITTTGATVLGANDTGAGGANFFTGYISNFRQVKGTAVYTSGFTPSTTPLTAVTNTQLLTCQSNRFIDNSTNNFAITVNGDTSVQRFNPFGASTAYSTTLIGGSGYFDGDDHLTAPNNATLKFGTSDFTLEFWLYYIGGEDVTGTFDGGTSSQCYQIFINGNEVRIRLYGAGGAIWNYGSMGSLRPRTWNHIALTRSGTTFRTFVNGVAGQTTTSSDSLKDYTGNIQIGKSQYYFSGYISDYRIVKGTALYTSAFTPPTVPLTAVTNTTLLTNFTNSAIFDNAMMNDLETVGNAQISTSVKKYGTGSLAFDGNGDWLASTAIEPNTFGSGDFTVEMWVYPVSSSTYGNLYCTEVYSAENVDATFQITLDSSLIPKTGTRSTYVVTSSSALSANTWSHLAVSRSGSSWKMFINGTQVGSATNSTSFVAGGFASGVLPRSTSNTWFNGYIDDLRITKGYARYTANFTPPAAAFPNTGPI